MPMPCARPSGWAMPRPIRRWTSTAATRPRSWPSWPIWPLAPGRLDRHSAPRHRHAGPGRHALCQGARLSHQAAGRGRADAEGVWNCTSRPRWSSSARRWPRCAERTTQSASWATRWAACSSRPGRRPDAHGVGRRGRFDRHGCRARGDHLPHARTMVARSGRRCPPATMPTSRAAITCGSAWPTSPACWPRSPGCWATRTSRSPRSFSTNQEDETQAVVPLVIMTHNTTEGAVSRASAAIDRLPFMRGRSVRMRVRDS